MIVFESRKSRRLIARLERGEDLVRGIEQLAEREHVRAAWIRGAGSLEWVELDRHDQARRAPEPHQRFDLPCDLLTLEGNVSVSGDSARAMLYATIARRTDNGVDVIGGRVRAGAVFHVELAIECFDDLVLARQKDASTGLAVWIGAPREERPIEREEAPRSERAPREERSIEREEAPPSASWTKPSSAPVSWAEVASVSEEEEERAPRVSWADVAKVSAAPEVTPSRRKSERPDDKRRRAEEEFLSAQLPERGDWIEHRQFGLCRVDREDEEGGLVIRLPSGIRKTIKLDFMEVGQVRHEGDRRIFPVRPRRR